MFKEALKHGLTWKNLLDDFSQLHLEVVVSKIKTMMEFKEDEREEKLIPVSGWVWFQQYTAVVEDSVPMLFKLGNRISLYY